MVTPNTNITAGSIDSTFLGDKSVTGDKINTTGALDNQVLSYDSATNTVIWQDVSNLDNTFENGIIVSGAQSTFAENVQINADLDLNGDIAISGSITDLTGISADSTFNLSSTANIELDATGYIHADTDNLYVGSLSQAVHITPTNIGGIGTLPIITASSITGPLTGNVTGQVSDISNHSINDIAANFNFLGNAAYPGYGIDLLVDESKWAGIQITSYDSSDNPFGIYNPNLIANIAEGSPGAITAVGSGKRIFSFSGTASNGTSFPATNNAVMSFQTTEAQTSSDRGTKIVLETINNGESSRVVSLQAHGKEITILPNGGTNPILDAGGDFLNVDCETRFNNTIVLDNVSSDPSSPAAGAMYFNVSTNKFRGYNGTAWVDLG
jgi:hypothetical protein